jgi:hypothetical protein
MRRPRHADRTRSSFALKCRRSAARSESAARASKFECGRPKTVLPDSKPETIRALSASRGSLLGCRAEPIPFCPQPVSWRAGAGRGLPSEFRCPLLSHCGHELLVVRITGYDPQQTFPCTRQCPALASLRHGFCILSLSFAAQTAAAALYRRMFIDQARATGGANRPPPNDPLARSVSKKNTMMSFGSMPASPSFSTKATTRAFFLSVSVPEDTSTSIINIWSERGLGSAG